MVTRSMPKFWYRRGISSYILFPFSLVYRVIIWLRKLYYRYGPRVKFPVPIIVVGNITVGGTGKTPLVIFLAQLLKNQGYFPGIVSRGYGRENSRGFMLVAADSKVTEVGDEALLISRQVDCPVIVDINRSRAVKALFMTYGCNVVISDDGLQHYALARDMEIVMIDAEFKFGNGFCLPAGPLREPLYRLQQVDFVIKNFNAHLPSELLVNEYSLTLEVVSFRNVIDQKIVRAVEDFKGCVIDAVAGIGLPDKFFQTLRQAGLSIVEHPFPDHHKFCREDFNFSGDGRHVVMTEKDAVKCGAIVGENCWYVEVRARPSQKFIGEFLDKVRSLSLIGRQR